MDTYQDLIGSGLDKNLEKMSSLGVAFSHTIDLCIIFMCIEQCHFTVISTVCVCNQGEPASRNHGDSVTLKLSFTAKRTTSLLFITLCCQLYLSHTQPHTHYGYTIFIVIFRCFINVTEATVESNSKSLMLIDILKMYLQL